MATRTLTDTATVSWDEATPNQVKGNVVGTPFGLALLGLTNSTALAALVDSFFLTPAEGDALFLTPAEGDALFLTPAEGAAAFQPLDTDLTELAAFRSVAAIHAFNFQNYR